MLFKISKSETIYTECPQFRFQAFHEIYMFKKLIGKSRGTKNKYCYSGIGSFYMEIEIVAPLVEKGEYKVDCQS